MCRIPYRCIVVLLVVAAAVAGCQPAAVAPPAPAPTVAAPSPAAPMVAAPSPAATTPAAIGPSGTVVWNGAPVAGARLKLVQPGGCATAGPAAVVATADAAGKFAFRDAPTGDFQLCAAWPETAGGGWSPAQVASGAPLSDITLELRKPVRLLAPDLAQPVETAPTISWEALPGIAGYRVLVADAGTTELIVQQELAGTSLAISQPLKPDHSYTLLVQGLGANHEPIAEFSGTFRAVAGRAPAAGDSLVALPQNCYREGLLTYVDRTARICFAYPQGFTLAPTQGSQAQVEVRGPAIGGGPEPLFASLTVETRPYQGQDLAPFVDELLKTNVPAGFPAKVERKQINFGGHAAEVLEPMPGRLSSRQVVVDFAPQSLFVLNFWPSFRDTAADQMTADAQQAQRDMDALFEVVAASFTTLPPDGVPIDAASRLDLPTTCVADGRPLYISADDRYCFALPPQFSARREANGQMSFYGPALDSSPEPLRAALGLTVEVAARDATLDRLATDYVASYQDLAPNIKRSALTMGNLQAIRLDGVPGRPAATEVLLLREGTFFQLRFTPDPSFEAARNDMAGLIDTVTGSFGFLPAPSVAPATGGPTPAAGTRSVSYEGTSFSYPAALAGDAAGKMLPAEGGSDGPWWATMPAHAEVTLTGYALSQTAQPPRVVVYPAAEFASLNQEAAGRIAALQQLLEKQPANTSGELPFLPLFNARQQMHFGVKYLSTAGVQGVRYLTQYAQGPVPINNQELFYTFQGLTRDGKYYVAAILPVSHDLLPAAFESVPLADRQKIAENFEKYIGDTTSALNAQPAGSFRPGLPDLDALVESIQISR